MDDSWKFDKLQNGRCINIDWLEVYCIEDCNRFPCNADYFRKQGWIVKERPYGTRQYKEMFVLLDKTDLPFVEIRRSPVAENCNASKVGIFDPASCHIRLHNRYCYHPQAVNFLSNFLMQHQYVMKHIYRLDICLDFEKFDKGDDPHKFMLRYLSGKYSKINQGNISSHGKDLWAERRWNSISWGSPSSMVSTKFYNKSLELKEGRDKPYIRYAWWCAGLIDDWTNCTKRNPDGSVYSPDIYRVEFSIRAHARQWYRIEDHNGRKTKNLVQEHTLGTYRTSDDLLHAFARLAHHYFHFKHYEEGVRKDRCEDKVLFDFGSNHTCYCLDRLLTSQTHKEVESALLKRLREYKLRHASEDIRNACDVLIESLTTESVRNSMPEWADRTEALLLQQLIKMRMTQLQKEPLQTSINKISSLLDLQNELF